MIIRYIIQFRNFCALYGAILLLLFPTLSFGKTRLKTIEMINDNSIAISFDANIDRRQISTEYNNDIIQITLNNVDVYPAKMLTGNNNPISKIFAYQYTPHITRCRFTVHGKAEDFKNKFHITSDGKYIKINVDSDAIENKDLSSVQVKSEKIETVSQSNISTQVPVDLSIVAKSKNTPNSLSEEDKSISEISKTLPSEKLNRSSENSGNPIPSFRSALLKLFWVVCIFLGFAGFVIKHKQTILTIIGKLTGKTYLGDAKGKGKLIEVIATHHLDPKKMISVVRIGKRQYVLGITQDAISLISETKSGNQYSDEEDQEDESGFSDMLSSESGKPFESSIRSRIKSRLEGLKQL